ncbi:MAG: hypothetical protein SWX82_09320 [Cyanobacteriota bacterium]|nr:hypothetical protein [Cyanobacteriota bacterium]
MDVKRREGRPKLEEGWNWDGDLNPNPILSPYDGREFNPYLEVKNATFMQQSH